MNGLRRRASALVSAAVAGALVLSGCSVYDVPLPGGPDAGDNPIHVKVLFRDVLDLVPQSTVKVNDVSVGKVTTINLKGYIAEVELELPRDIKLPENTSAQIRQTSLLGEKFVSLSPPEQDGTGKLGDKDVIGLDRTGRNPEVEEVFGALALILNGGGVGQLKTIAAELNNAFDGRESEARSVLSQIRIFMSQLDKNKTSIVAALENTSRLAVRLRQQDSTIKSALDKIPNTLRSVNRQRADLVKLLEALNRLSGVGVRVIKASKESTINSLRDLAPVLEGFAKAGDNFPKSFQVFLTYPFVDEAIGRDPQVARNLHMGDYTNLSVNLDVDLADLAIPEVPIPIPSEVCNLAKRIRSEVRKQVAQLPNLPGGLGEKELIDAVVKAVQGVSCSTGTNGLRKAVAQALVDVLTSPLVQNLCPKGSSNPLCKILRDPTGLPSIGLPSLGAGGVGGGLLPRGQLGSGYRVPEPLDPFGLAERGIDPGIGTMLLQGVAEVR